MKLNAVIENKLLLATGFLYGLTFLFSRGTVTLALQNTSHYLREMLFVMPVILMLTVFIDVWVSKETIIKHMGEGSGLKGTAFSVLLGSLSAGPIYAAFPICKMLLSKGASVANLVVILSAWAVIKVPMLANEARFLGPKFMVMRWVLSVIIIYFMGYTMSLLVKKESIVHGVESVREGLCVNQAACVGCGICAVKHPDHFIMNGKKADVKSSGEPVDAATAGAMIDICPVNAIAHER